MSGTRRAEPTVWSAILADPTLPFDRATLRKVVKDQQRWSRQWLYPVVRVLSLVSVTMILVWKRLVPFAGRLSAHPAMDRLCVWFLRRCVAPESAELLLRHFVVETNLLNFVVRNSGVPGLAEVGLRPTSLRELGNRAVIEHDLNVYEVLVALGAGASHTPLRRPPADLDVSMLAMPALDVEADRRRLIALDIQTALCLMNIPFALCLTPSQYRRAVHSLRLDESLLAVLATLTGDCTFRSWRPAGTLVRVDSRMDVPRAVYEHAVICELAHAHLLGSRAAEGVGGAGYRAVSSMPGRRRPGAVSIGSRRVADREESYGRADHHRADHHRADHHRGSHRGGDHCRADHCQKDRIRRDRTGGARA